MRDYRAAGGRTIVDLTIPDIGRSAELIRQVSSQTGVHLVAGCGHYVDAAHPPDLKEMTVEAIAQVLEAELTEGIGDTGIRPGVIGEVGTGNPITNGERKVLRAAALAHGRTGAPLSIHLFPARRDSGGSTRCPAGRGRSRPRRSSWDTSTGRTRSAPSCICSWPPGVPTSSRHVRGQLVQR